MWTRRELLKSGAAGLALAALPRRFSAGTAELRVNDVHSKLNPTSVARIARPDSTEALAALVRGAARDGRPLCLAGGRHAMGGQQFRRGALLVDTTALSQVHAYDAALGEIEVGAGIQWPELVEALRTLRTRGEPGFSIVQKQTGADRLCLGGALSANAHGRGLALAPISGDVAAFTLVDASGGLLRCSRSENAERFALALGGYGLFGAIASVRLRLAPRRRLERVVEVIDLADLARRVAARTAEGFLYGDCQYDVALDRETGLRRGVFSCYRPVPDTAPLAAERRLGEDDWRELVRLAHLDPARAFDAYAAYYLSTSGQIYDSDTHQLSTYLDDYHAQLGARLGAFGSGSEMISELYVPRDALGAFLEAIRRDLREHGARLIYGTVRWIERDADSFLAWAREPWACVVVNLHTQHDAASLARTALDFQRLIDRALAHGGSYFLTYHRFARPEQVLAAHPRFREFLAQKRRFDPEERFASDWYAHYRDVFAAGGVA
jgi:FAD/FMN-containing dehydrogenase